MSAQFPECSSVLNDVIEIQDIIGSMKRQRDYTTISNEDLDTHVLRLTHGNPLLGQRNVQGLLSSEGLVVQRSRVAESLTRVDGAANDSATIIQCAWAKCIVAH
ncbi:hypothetical protein DPMN_158948 [Dreissena polymorpha]|uniref:Uncharacterized protein n=1 Tax=Dreissena polymorpha TaxID=45954 RepID=A0A9D4EKS4_DREPO|nr:hypothetical protein DPMN_158948 [Dreissena polymorpha]